MSDSQNSGGTILASLQYHKTQILFHHIS